MVLKVQMEKSKTYTSISHLSSSPNYRHDGYPKSSFFNHQTTQQIQVHFWVPQTMVYMLLNSGCINQGVYTHTHTHTHTRSFRMVPLTVSQLYDGVKTICLQEKTYFKF